MKLDALDREFVAAVQELEDHRRAVAAATKELRERELEARLLRLTVETRLRTGTKNDSGEWLVAPCVKTEAEKLAKADPEYLAFERETICLEFAKAIEEAKAEGLSLELRATIAQDGALA